MSNPHRISIFLILLLFLGLIFVAVSDLLSFHEDDFDLSEACRYRCRRPAIMIHPTSKSP